MERSEVGRWFNCSRQELSPGLNTINRYPHIRHKDATYPNSRLIDVNVRRTSATFCYTPLHVLLIVSTYFSHTLVNLYRLSFVDSLSVHHSMIPLTSSLCCTLLSFSLCHILTIIVALGPV